MPNVLGSRDYNKYLIKPRIRLEVDRVFGGNGDSESTLVVENEIFGRILRLHLALPLCPLGCQASSVIISISVS